MARGWSAHVPWFVWFVCVFLIEAPDDGFYLDGQLGCEDPKAPYLEVGALMHPYMYPMLRNNAAGPEIGLPGRSSA